MDFQRFIYKNLAKNSYKNKGAYKKLTEYYVFRGTRRTSFSSQNHFLTLNIKYEKLLTNIRTISPDNILDSVKRWNLTLGNQNLVSTFIIKHSVLCIVSLPQNVVERPCERCEDNHCWFFPCSFGKHWAVHQLIQCILTIRT